MSNKPIGEPVDEFIARRTKEQKRKEVEEAIKVLNEKIVAYRKTSDQGTFSFDWQSDTPISVEWEA